MMLLSVFKVASTRLFYIYRKLSNRSRTLQPPHPVVTGNHITRTIRNLIFRIRCSWNHQLYSKYSLYNTVGIR